jgi:hypothetical protein
MDDFKCLKCKCGTGIEEWFYLEHVVAFRRVLGASKDTVNIFDAYNIEDDAVVLSSYNIDSNSKPPSFFCRKCRTVIPIPAGLKLKFVKV